MATNLPFDEMSAEDKIHTMELLWDGLCKKGGGVILPAWHGEILAERESMHKAGTDEFEDWNVAKGKIRNQTS